MEVQRAFGELHPAGAQAAAVQCGGVEAESPPDPPSCFEQLEHELAGEVGEREHNRLQGPPGPTVVPARGGDLGDPRGGQRREALQRRRRPGGAGADRLYAHPAGEHRAQRVARARRGLALERRVPGVGHDQQVRVGDLRGECAGVGCGGAQVVGAADDQRGDVGHGFRHRRGRGGGERPEGAGAQLVEVEHVRGGEGRGHARRQGVDCRRWPGRGVRRGWRRGSRGTPPLRRWWRGRAGTSMPSLSSFSPPYAPSARASRRTSGAVSPSAAAARAAAGSSARRIGSKSPASRMSSSTLAETWTVTGWPWPPI